MKCCQCGSDQGVKTSAVAFFRNVNIQEKGDGDHGMCNDFCSLCFEDLYQRFIETIKDFHVLKVDTLQYFRLEVQ